MTLPDDVPVDHVPVHDVPVHDVPVHDVPVDGIGRAVGALGWAVAAIAGGVLATQAIGTPFRVVAVAQALTPLMVPVVVVAAVVATWRRRHGAAVATALVGAGHLALLAPLVFAGGGPPPGVDEPTVSIVSANVLFENRRIDEAADALAALDVDVLALSEVTPDIVERLRRHPLAADYPHRVEAPARAASGLLIWSRLPLGPVGEQPDFRRAIDTTVITGDGLLRLLLVHPPPPVFALDRWHAELDAIGRVVGQTTFPTVVLGDFNASYFHPPFRRMMRRADLRDAVVAHGAALTPTWPTDRTVPPIAALDHVLVQPSVATLDASVVEIPGSDHRAVVTTVTFAARS